jgi:crotonobetainyl-CoA:carnitine CoA-transferase CaiB-like acyl-CoA transferase
VKRPVAWWVKRLDDAGIPCGPINDIAQAMADPQVAARGLRIDLSHPLAGVAPLVANPIVVRDAPTYELASDAGAAHRRDPARARGYRR